MRLVAAAVHHAPQKPTYGELKQEIHNLQLTIKGFTEPHHSLLGGWLHDLASNASTYLPIFFILILSVTAWLLWRMAGAMPRTKPQNMATKGSSSTTWNDVAGVEEVRAELEE